MATLLLVMYQADGETRHRTSYYDYSGTCDPGSESP